MLAVIIFVAFWVVVALALFFAAARGGVGGARGAFQSRSRTGQRALTLSFIVAYVGFGIALPIVLELGNRTHSNRQVGGLKLAAAEKSGRELFGVHCAVCHTLSAASAFGQVGPNLDTLMPNRALVLHTIRNGCLPNVSSSDPQYCLGYGVMPANVVQGRDADQIASFVARVAGRE